MQVESSPPNPLAIDRRPDIMGALWVRGARGRRLAVNVGRARPNLRESLGTGGRTGDLRHGKHSGALCLRKVSRGGL